MANSKCGAPKRHVFRSCLPLILLHWNLTIFVADNGSENLGQAPCACLSPHHCDYSCFGIPVTGTSFGDHELLILLVYSNNGSGRDKGKGDCPQNWSCLNAPIIFACTNKKIAFVKAEQEGKPSLLPLSSTSRFSNGKPEPFICQNWRCGHTKFDFELIFLWITDVYIPVLVDSLRILTCGNATSVMSGRYTVADIGKRALHELIWDWSGRRLISASNVSRTEYLRSLGHWTERKRWTTTSKIDYPNSFLRSSTVFFDLL